MTFDTLSEKFCPMVSEAVKWGQYREDRHLGVVIGGKK